MKCAVCAKPQAQRLCGKCQFIAYCGEECAERDWQHHYVQTHAPPAFFLGQHYVDDNIMDPILPGLWVGGVDALAHLGEFNIGAVVTLLSPDQDHIEESLLSQYVGNRPHLRYAWYDAEDQKLPFEDLCRAARFIEKHRKTQGGVLVHCAAGHSRSVSVVIFYMMHTPEGKKKWKTVQLALQHIQRTRTNAYPNKSFWKQLKEYANRAC